MCDVCSVEVGSSALPPLLTLRNVIQQRRMSLVFSGNELPVRPTSAYDNEYWRSSCVIDFMSGGHLFLYVTYMYTRCIHKYPVHTVLHQLYPIDNWFCKKHFDQSLDFNWSHSLKWMGNWTECRCTLFIFIRCLTGIKRPLDEIFLNALIRLYSYAFADGVARASRAPVAQHRGLSDPSAAVYWGEPADASHLRPRHLARRSLAHSWRRRRVRDVASCLSSVLWCEARCYQFDLSWVL